MPSEPMDWERLRADLTLLDAPLANTMDDAGERFEAKRRIGRSFETLVRLALAAHDWRKAEREVEEARAEYEAVYFALIEAAYDGRVQVKEKDRAVIRTPAARKALSDAEKARDAARARFDALAGGEPTPPAREEG